MMMLHLDRLSKRFGTQVAVDRLSLRVGPDEVYGLIGPNGSGKTTTVKMVTGLYRPTDGRVAIGGHDLETSPEAAKRLIGYIPDEPFVYEKMPGREFLHIWWESCMASRAPRERRRSPNCSISMRSGASWMAIWRTIRVATSRTWLSWPACFTARAERRA